MIDDEFLKADLTGYENTLVKQFRVLEKLVEVTNKERDLLLGGSSDALMKNTEEKESILDKFTLLEENSRMFLHKLFLKLAIHSEGGKIEELMPFLSPVDCDRINRLLDGIKILVEKAREINWGNQALVMTRMDWLMATQSFIATVVQPEECYSMPMLDGTNRNSAISGLEFRA